MSDETMLVQVTRVSSGGDVPDIVQMEMTNDNVHIRISFTMEEYARFLTGEAHLPVKVGRLKFYGEDWMKQAYLAARKESERIRKDVDEVIRLRDEEIASLKALLCRALPFADCGERDGDPACVLRVNIEDALK